MYQFSIDERRCERASWQFSDEVKDNEVDGQENLEWSSEETLSENDMTDEESDLEPEEMNVDEEGETEDGTDESGI